MPDRFDPGELDRMLDGDVPWPPGLAELRAAARAPGRPDELAGEAAAVAAFRAAGPSIRGARTLGRLLTVKVAAAAAVLAGGGLAVAAATGNLPAPLAPPPERPAPVVSPSSDGTPGRAVPPAVPPPTHTTPTPAGAAPSGPSPSGTGVGPGHGKDKDTGKPSKSPRPPKPSRSHPGNGPPTPPPTGPPSP